MTKYVLNSGGWRNNPELAKKFFAEVAKGLGSAPRLLLCCFAQPREDWEERFVAYSKDIHTFFPQGIFPVITLAFPETFVEQMKVTDILYMHGGDDHLLQYWLRQFDIPNVWDNKVVATGSASSNALALHFWTCDWRKCMDGLGILPIKFLPHYESPYGAEDPRGPIDWRGAYEELKQYGDSLLPMHALKEGEYVVIEK